MAKLLAVCLIVRTKFPTPTPPTHTRRDRETERYRERQRHTETELSMIVGVCNPSSGKRQEDRSDSLASLSRWNRDLQVQQISFVLKIRWREIQGRHLGLNSVLQMHLYMPRNTPHGHSFKMPPMHTKRQCTLVTCMQISLWLHNKGRKDWGEALCLVRQMLTIFNVVNLTL